ncbi:unnamed protein product [Moneuplotes crassus]|uniref:Peptidase M20 dimerisation domain-containing protein n=1 Tax=Euplotes crassus TaxID=5936 RepID=A0AAD1XEJ7_EUPCR|nr:unnamed protein product [Moneuplotes crassus]
MESSTPEVPFYDILTAEGIDFSDIIKLRKHFHKYPELGFKEFETRKKILEYFTEIEPENIYTMGETGIVIDIKGTGPESQEGSCQTIAFRADMDALPMVEETGLDYTSTTDCAHMCGHDGHMATLIATAQFWMKNRPKIPQNKTIRLLFQPAEEGPGGALPMIEEGCLEGVDEVYGYHNAPFGEEGSISLKSGGFMAGSVEIRIEIEGKGGHGSEPAHSIDPITAACSLHASFHSIKSRNTFNTDVVSFVICAFNSGTADNVIPRTAHMRGTLRYYDEKVRDKVIERIKTLTDSVCTGFECKSNLELIYKYPPVMNHLEQTENVLKIAKKQLGDDKVNTTEHLPWFASEDFSYYLQKVPGCFIVLNNVKPGGEAISLHSSMMDFNDNIIPTGVYLNIKISEDRLGIKILS